MSKAKRPKGVLGHILDRGRAADRHLAFQAELSRSSDRSAAILVAADLEQLVASLVITELTNSEENHLAILFSRDGPLGSFFSVCQLAYALGLIEKDELAQLDTYRRVRNSFAHSILVASFDSDALIEDIRRLGISETRPNRDHFLDCYSMLYQSINARRMARMETAVTEMMNEVQGRLSSQGKSEEEINNIKEGMRIAIANLAVAHGVSETRAREMARSLVKDA